MGYCVNVTEIDFRMSDISGAIKSLSGLIGDGTRNYSWVSGIELRVVLNKRGEWSDDRVLIELLRLFRWEAERSTSPKGRKHQGSFIITGFNGEKLGDDELLFETLSPHVRPGSFIDFIGEDGFLWQWSFYDGEMRELTGTITWE